MLAFLRRLFGNTNDSECEETSMKKFLIVGLGNIGPKYENTRHNIGFSVVETLAARRDVSFESKKLADVAKLRIKGRQLILIKPSTYMNLSGKALNYWLRQEKIPLENLLVITDDLNLPFGSIRFKKKGSDGGHNGLRDIQATLGTTTYNRFRFGISDEFSKGRQVDYVLSPWTSEESEKLKERLETSVKAVESFVLAGMDHTMNNFNGK